MPVKNYPPAPLSTHTGKQKSLHALSLNPASAMDPDALSTLPEGTTLSPYDAKAVKREGQEVCVCVYVCVNVCACVCICVYVHALMCCA